MTVDAGRGFGRAGRHRDCGTARWKYAALGGSVGSGGAVVCGQCVGGGDDRGAVESLHVGFSSRFGVGDADGARGGFGGAKGLVAGFGLCSCRVTACLCGFQCVGQFAGA